jgi:hypothetical protein
VVGSAGRHGGGVAGNAGRLGGGDGGADGVSAAVGGGLGARGSDVVALGTLGDTELVRVLELTGHIVDELETVVGGVSLEAGGRSPLVGTAVGDAGDNGGERLDVLSRATEEDERNAVSGGWLPRDGEGLAGRDNLYRVSVDVHVSRRIPIDVVVATNKRHASLEVRCIPRSRGG